MAPVRCACGGWYLGNRLCTNGIPGLDGDHKPEQEPDGMDEEDTPPPPRRLERSPVPRMPMDAEEPPPPFCRLEPEPDPGTLGREPGEIDVEKSQRSAGAPEQGPDKRQCPTQGKISAMRRDKRNKLRIERASSTRKLANPF